MHSLARYLPPGEAKVVVWGNELSQRCAKMISATMGAFEEHWWQAYEGNMPKYQVMRHLWHENPETVPTTPWVLWFDDDTHIVAPDWWEKTRAFLEAKKAENICYAGFKWYKHHEPGQAEFIEAAEWYKGVPWEQCPTRRKGVRKPGITFANGAYFWLRSDVMRQINWPDPRLVHNGGDTLLGEAIRQQGLPFHELKYGVKGNDARRRGRSDTPAGSKKGGRR
jgi:hypothetical protein